MAYLLLVGEKPTAPQYHAFCREIQQHMPLGESFRLEWMRLVHEKVKAMFSNFTINAHPMAIMVSSTS